jgi:hypothetical protein
MNAPHEGIGIGRDDRKSDDALGDGSFVSSSHANGLTINPSRLIFFLSWVSSAIGLRLDSIFSAY